MYDRSGTPTTVRKFTSDVQDVRDPCRASMQKSAQNIRLLRLLDGLGDLLEDLARVGALDPLLGQLVQLLDAAGLSA